MDQSIVPILDTWSPMAVKNRKVGMLFTVYLATESKQTHTHRHPLKHVTMYSMFISCHPRSQDRARNWSQSVARYQSTVVLNFPPNVNTRLPRLLCRYLAHVLKLLCRHVPGTCRVTFLPDSCMEEEMGADKGAMEAWVKGRPSSLKGGSLGSGFETRYKATLEHFITLHSTWCI